MKTLLLIDGNALMHRAFHALPPFTTKEGFPTNALFGFLSILNKVVNDFNPYYLIVCFDTPKPTFRKKIFKEYQAQRPKLEDKLSIQFPKVKEALETAGITHLEKEGYEADDLIGTISQKYSKNEIMVLILSGDRDILQLVSNRVQVLTPQLGFGKEKIYDCAQVEKKLGIKPKQIPDFKALVGDPSDNYQGAKGIGPKTAVKLLNQFKTIDNIFENIEKIEPKIKEILKKNKKNIFLSRQLATIITNVPIKFSIEKTKFEGFNKNLKEFLLKYGIKSLAQRMFPQSPPRKIAASPNKEIKKIKNHNEKQMGLF